MPIVGGLDIHRKQITFDYLDTMTGEVQRGQVCPADRLHLGGWLARFAGREDVAFAVEGCAGWRYVAEELAAAGITAHLAEPAGTAALRGRKRRAKTDKTDARHLRMLLAEARLPECWIPPGRILECPALPGAVQRPAPRAHRLGPADPRGAVPPGRPGAGSGRAAHRAGHSRGAGRGGRAPAGGRAAAGRHRPGGDRGPGNPAPPAAAPTARRGPAPGRRQGPGRAAVRGRAGHRAGDHLLAGRRAGSPPPARWSGSRGSTSPCPPRTARARPGGCPGRGRRCCAGPSTRRARRTPGPRRRTTATTPRSRTARTASAPACPGARKILRQAHHILAELGDDALAAA
jgi:transposase